MKKLLMSGKRKPLRKVYMAFLIVIIQIVQSPAEVNAKKLTAQQIPDSCLKVMTYNIRYDNPGDGTNAWKFRRKPLVTLIKNYKPDILCVQEALVNQMEYIDSCLTDHHYYGVGRDDGFYKGEFSGIFYNNTLFEVQDSGTFWLSDTPAIAGSIGWDAACIRVVTWLKLKGKEDDLTFYIFNTHFDHIGSLARKESSKLLLAMIDTIAQDTPVIVAGDFNFNEADETFRSIVQQTGYQHHLLSARTTAKLSSGPPYTYIGFCFTGVPGEIIDHIFVSDPIEVISYSVLEDNQDGIYPSDHLPVLVKIKKDAIPR